MQRNNLKSNNRTYKKTVGRGGSRGKTSGRGHKGQGARAGHSIRPEYRDVIKRMPKLRGRGKNIFQSPNKPTVAIKLSVLDKNFENGEVVSPKTLLEKGLISTKEAKFYNIKVVSGGELNKTLKVLGCKMTKSVEAKFEKVADKKA